MVENLTDEISRRALEYIRTIDQMGGALNAIESGYMQREIQDAAFQFQKAIENKEEIVVGVNQFQVEEKLELEALRVNPAIESGQRARLAELRQQRDSQQASELLSHLDSAARGQENLIPLLIECVENDLTLGEICNVLRKTWGEYQPPAWI